MDLVSTGSRLPVLNLLHDKGRLAVSLAGIAFAVMLIFAQVGFLNALLDSTVQVIQSLNADIIVSSKLRTIVSSSQSFAKRRIHQALAVPGVAAVYPVRLSERLWKNPVTGKASAIRAIAFDPSTPTFLDPQIRRYQGLLKLPRTVLTDVKSKKHYGPMGPGILTELDRRSVRVVGRFTMGTDFTVSGNIITNERNYLNLFGDDDSVRTEHRKLDLGLVNLAEGADPDAVKRALREAFPEDLAALTKEEWIQQERMFWLEATPVGFVFGLGAVLGFIVGIMICYQVLFTDIMDHLPQFATLKAMGYSRLYMTRVVLTEALILSLIGFGPGLVLSQFLYLTVSWVSGLPMELVAVQIVIVLAMTVGMCMTAGLFAIRKVLSADAAELFR